MRSITSETPFQFHFGTIKRSYRDNVIKLAGNFNSTLVRLKVNATNLYDFTAVGFQFHFGTIKSLTVLGARSVFRYFNSTLVRLKVVGWLWDSDITKFQFHFGTIKSGYPVVVTSSVFEFQFHFGTIKSQYATKHGLHPRNFNSTLVRLKGWPPYCANWRTLSFQFHFGTIKRVTLRRAWF